MVISIKLRLVVTGLPVYDYERGLAIKRSPLLTAKPKTVTDFSGKSEMLADSALSLVLKVP